jgi:hypothetical protein
MTAVVLYESVWINAKGVKTQIDVRLSILRIDICGIRRIKVDETTVL